MSGSKADQKAEAAVEQSFPASDAPATTGTAGVKLDPGIYANRTVPDMGLRMLLTGGLQAAYQQEQAELAWLGEVEACVTNPRLRQALTTLAESGSRQVQALAGTLAGFGMPHDGAPGHARAPHPALLRGAPGGGLRDLTIAIAARRGQEQLASLSEALSGLAAANALGSEAGALQTEAAARQRGIAALAGLTPALIEAAADSGGAMLSPSFVINVFGGQAES